MTEVVVAQRMWQRRGTAAQWTTANPILHAGEIGVELPAAGSTLCKFKLGDGITTWTSLPYFASGATLDIRVSSGYMQYSTTGSGGPWTNIVEMSTLQGPAGPAGPPGADGADGADGAMGPAGPANSAYICAVFVATGGGDIADDTRCEVYVPYACTLTKATLLGSHTGTIKIDIYASSLTAYPPSSSGSICPGAARPALVSAIRSQNTTLTGWTTSIAAGTTLRFNVDECSGIERATLILEGTR